MSMTGVPSSASRWLTRIRKSSIDRIVTRCRPIGFGRSGDRVLNDAGDRSVGIAAGVNSQNVTLCQVQPGQHQDLAARGEVLRGITHLRIENDPGVRSTLVALPRSLVRSGQRRFDYPDGSQQEAGLLSLACRHGCPPSANPP